MQNYLDIKKIYNLNNKNKYSSKRINTSNPKNVDINTLLNRVRLSKKNKTKENFIFLGTGLTIISVTSLFLIF